MHLGASWNKEYLAGVSASLGFLCEGYSDREIDD